MYTRAAVGLMLALNAAAAPHTFEVVVYGGTAGGVIAAVAAAREGRRTALIEPTSHVGGMEKIIVSCFERMRVCQRKVKPDQRFAHPSAFPERFTIRLR